MAKELQPAVGSPGHFERLRRSALVKAALGMSAFVLGGSSVSSGSRAAAAERQAAASHQLEYVGMATNQIWDTSIDNARQAAGEIADTGANTVKIYEPISPGQADIKNDRLRLCNAAEAAREKNLTLDIGFIGVHHIDSAHVKTAFIPNGAAAVSKALNTINKIINNIAGPNANQPTPDGPACVEEPLKRVVITIFNEVNSPNFNASQDPAMMYAYLMSRAYQAIQTDVLTINQKLEASSDPAVSPPLVLKVAALALSATKQPLNFLEKYDADLKQLGVTAPPEDMIAVHPYSSAANGSPADVMAGLYGPLEAQEQSAWGRPVAVFYDEFAVFSIPKAKRALYGPKSLAVPLVSGGQQAETYGDAFDEAANEPYVVGALTFQAADRTNDGWPSGIDTPDGAHKEGGWNQFSLAVHQVKAG